MRQPVSREMIACYRQRRAAERQEQWQAGYATGMAVLTRDVIPALRVEFVGIAYDAGAIQDEGDRDYVAAYSWLMGEPEDPEMARRWWTQYVGRCPRYPFFFRGFFAAIHELWREMDMA